MQDEQQVSSGGLMPITRNLLIINGLMWIAQYVFALRLHIDLADLLGLHYALSSDFMPWQSLTYMFLHSQEGFQHILFNMLSLWMFGSVVEQIWGSARFLFFYIICGVSAALVQQAVWHYELMDVLALSAEQLINLGGGRIVTQEQLLNLPITIGASGAVLGLLLAFGWLMPNARMVLIFFPFFPIKAKYFVIGYGLVELFLGVSATGSNIAHFAHLGGMLGGLILIHLWRKRGEIDGPYR